MFECVNQAAVHEELEDETRRLCDIRPFLPVLKLVTRNCGRAERLLDSKIGVLIGKGQFIARVYGHMLKERQTCKDLQSTRGQQQIFISQKNDPMNNHLIYSLILPHEVVCDRKAVLSPEHRR